MKNFNKNSINRKKRNLKILQKRENELTNLLNNKNLQMIDETIYKTAKDKFKELSILNKIIKESAIDCYLFNNFHNKSLNDNEKITCKQL